MCSYETIFYLYILNINKIVLKIKFTSFLFTKGEKFMVCTKNIKEPFLLKDYRKIN